MWPGNAHNLLAIRGVELLKRSAPCVTLPHHVHDVCHRVLHASQMFEFTHKGGYCQISVTQNTCISETTGVMRTQGC